MIFDELTIGQMFRVVPSVNGQVYIRILWRRVQHGEGGLFLREVNAIKSDDDGYIAIAKPGRRDPYAHAASMFHFMPDHPVFNVVAGHGMRFMRTPDSELEKVKEREGPI